MEQNGTRARTSRFGRVEGKSVGRRTRGVKQTTVGERLVDRERLARPAGRRRSRRTAGYCVAHSDRARPRRYSARIFGESKRTSDFYYSSEN